MRWLRAILLLTLITFTTIFGILIHFHSTVQHHKLKGGRCVNTPTTITPTLWKIMRWTTNPNRKWTNNVYNDTVPEVFISVKATARVHASRLTLITTTWMQNTIPSQVTWYWYLNFGMRSFL